MSASDMMRHLFTHGPRPVAGAIFVLAVFFALALPNSVAWAKPAAQSSTPTPIAGEPPSSTLSPASTLIAGPTGVPTAVEPRLQAPSSVTWSPPIILSDPKNAAGMAGMAVDSSGMVHVMWGEKDPKEDSAAEGTALIYARFDGQNWTTPKDVLTSLAGGGAEAPSMAYTPDGFLHVVWGTGGRDSQLMYARAPACCADVPASWSKPIALGSPVNFTTALTVDHRGRLHTVFASLDTGNLSYFRSDDSGLTWNLRRQIQGLVRVGDEYPIYPSIAVDRADRVHVVWTIQPWPGSFALYARSDDGGETWPEPQIIDRADSNEFSAKNYGPIHISVFASTSPEGVNRVHMLWDGPPTVERNYIYSDDGGKTWSGRQLIFPEITLAGRAGFNPLLMDSAGTLHVISFGYHSIWLGTSWLKPSILFNNNGSGEWLAAAISLGNRINVIWQNKQDASAPINIGFASARTSAPEIPPRPVPEIPREQLQLQPVPPGDLLKATATPDAGPRPPTPAPTIPVINADPIRLTDNPMDASLLGIVPVILIFAGIIGLRLWRRSARSL